MNIASTVLKIASRRKKKIKNLFQVIVLYITAGNQTECQSQSDLTHPVINMKYEILLKHIF